MRLAGRLHVTLADPAPPLHIAPMSQHTDNPFFRPWTTPFGIAPFAEIAIDHYRPALSLIHISEPTRPY